MASLLSVRLSKGDCPSWGFRLQGGKDFGTPLVIQKVIVGSPAERAGLIAGDSVIRVNNTDVFNLRHKDAQDVLLRSGNTFDMTIQRGGSTWKPSVIPTGTLSTPSPTINNISPVTRTSLAAKSSENIGAIGTGHNVSAKPFLNGTLNGGPKLVNTQYNSPLKLYSEESIAETLSAQTEVLSTGALGVNFKKNEKNYDVSKSAVLSLLKEEETSPRSQDHTDNHHTSGIDAAPSPVGIAGLRHVTAPETKPQPPSPQLPPGQNICADCERLIVGVFVRIKDKNLHVECFKCSTCGTSLKNVGYYNINNKLYCDIHAKLAARNNPPAPNLVPITVPPGGKVPANAISAALASHPYPTAAPLSPKINSYSAPLSGPKPFGSVPGPLSPSSNFNSLPRTGAPLSPVAPISAPAYSPVSTTVHSVSSIVWPPVQEEPELPSACPLFYPPPSQVVIKPRKRLDSKDSNCSELEEINSMDQFNSQKFEDINYPSGRRSATECVETIAETLDRQMLVETIIRSRPQSPPPSIMPQSNREEPRKQKEQEYFEDNTTVNDSFQINLVEPENQIKSKFGNIVPKKWESEMLQALTISVDEPSTVTSSALKLNSYKEKENLDDNPEDSFLQIPTKQTSTRLGSALAVAPKEPFNPTKISIMDHVPLPEETVPYFPPETLFTVPLKEPQDKENVRPFKKKKDPNIEKLMDDLPKPQTKLSLRSALTTAPDRPFTPISFEKMITEKSETKSSTEVSETKTTKSHVTETVRPTSLQYTLQVQDQADQTPSPEYLPHFQGFTCSFQNKTDHSKFDVQIATTPPVRDKRSKRPATQNTNEKSSEIKETIKTEVTEKTSKIEKSSSCVKEDIQMTEEKENKSVTQKKENILYKKPEQMVSLRKPEMLPQYQVSVKQNAEADIIMMERMERARQKKEQEKIQQELQKTQVEMKSHQVAQGLHKDVAKQTTVQTCPEIKLQEVSIYSDNNTFRPVVDSSPQSCTFSPRPRPVTPSMVNKPPPILPYYQANLVAQKYGPPSVNLLDPKSPAISRSPSPLPNSSRPSQFLSTKQSNIRPKSPAQGPPDNPMECEYLPTRQDFQLESAKDNLVAFIPQYKEIRDMREESDVINKGKESRNEQRNVMYTADVVTKKESMPVISIEAVSRIEELSQSSDNQQKSCKKNETNVHQTADSRKEECQSHISDNIASTVKVCEKSHLEKSENFKKLEDKSLERSDDGSIQIQKKRTVTEEVEHTQKSQEIVIEKNVTTVNQQGFRNVRNPEENNQHVIGLHVTAPNPIRSPFFKSSQNAAPPKLTTICQKVGKEVPCKKPDACLQCPKKQDPILPKFDATTLPKPKTVPDLPTATREQKIIPPKPIKHVNPPGSSVLNQQLNPSLPHSDIGAGGGRQTGAIGITPKRGRGVLNAAQLGGRIALCGHCHGQIRGPFITALGKIWCPSHFICATPSCRRPLQDLGFVEEQGQLYCEYCFEQYLAPNCSKCGSKIKGDCLKAIGKAFHPECFNCVHCGKLFGNTPFFLEDGSPYCDTDWNEMFTTKCFACGFPVEAGDRWVEALSNNYHSQCFNCTMCKKNLEGQSFFAKGGRPYCKNHAR